MFREYTILYSILKFKLTIIPNSSTAVMDCWVNVGLGVVVTLVLGGKVVVVKRQGGFVSRLPYPWPRCGFRILGSLMSFMLSMSEVPLVSLSVSAWSASFMSARATDAAAKSRRRKR